MTDDQQMTEDCVIIPASRMRTQANDSIQGRCSMIVMAACI